MLGRRRLPLRQGEELHPSKKKKWQLEQEAYVHATPSEKSGGGSIAATLDSLASSDKTADTVHPRLQSYVPVESRKIERTETAEGEVDRSFDGVSLHSSNSDAEDHGPNQETSNTAYEHEEMEEESARKQLLGDNTGPTDSKHESNLQSEENGMKGSVDGGSLAATNGGEGVQGKRKRYEWMDSDDEDITSSSEDENEEELENEGKRKSEEAQSSTVEAAGSPLSDSQVDDALKETVKLAFISNISWEAKLEDLSSWIEKLSNHKVVSITPETSNSAAPNTSLRKVTSSTHKGRVFVELENHQALLDILKLNERPFMGRAIKIIRAYKRQGQFFLLQTPAHYRFFYQQKQMPQVSQKPLKVKQHKVDGGFNWAK